MPRGAQLIVILWRDIPAQVNARSRQEKHQILLKPRFQKAIDRAAMVGEITTASAYVNEWRQVAQPVTGDLAEAARREAERLEEAFPIERLDQLVAAAGFDPDTANGHHKADQEHEADHTTDLGTRSTPDQQQGNTP